MLHMGKTRTSHKAATNGTKKAAELPATPRVHEDLPPEPPSPVIGLHVTPSGPRYLFEELVQHGRGDRCFSIGSSEECDIQIRDATVSRKHCMIVRHQSRVYVTDTGSTNGLWVGGRRVVTWELHEGSVITLGTVDIAAISPASAQHEIIIAAGTVQDFVRRAVKAHGSMHAAADAIGVPYSTLYGWLRKQEAPQDKAGSKP